MRAARAIARVKKNAAASAILAGTAASSKLPRLREESIR
jgi:hypothetical protein